MATKPAFEIPRFLLPKLTWTTSGPALVKVSPHAKPRQRLRSVSSRLTTTSFLTVPSQRALHTSFIITTSSRTLQKTPTTPLSHLRRPSNRTSQRRSLSTSNPLSPTTTPIRHNGIYAHVFKPARRAFSNTSRPQKDHHFDTLKFVRRLKSEGLNEAQAVAMMHVLNDVIEESIQNLTRTMVLKEDAERSTYTQKVDFAKLRSELANADSTEAQLTKSSHERLASDLAKLSSRLRDEISRTQASVRLDLNLEKGRIREEATGQEMRIKETEARIEQEVAGLRERVEQVKFSTLQWLMGVCTGTAALILGAWRLLM